jgi:hypothetical protein
MTDLPEVCTLLEENIAAQKEVWMKEKEARKGKRRFESADINTNIKTTASDINTGIRPVIGAVGDHVQQVNSTRTEASVTPTLPLGSSGLFGAPSSSELAGSLKPIGSLDSLDSECLRRLGSLGTTGLTGSASAPCVLPSSATAALPSHIPQHYERVTEAFPGENQVELEPDHEVKQAPKPELDNAVDKPLNHSVDNSLNDSFNHVLSYRSDKLRVSNETEVTLCVRELAWGDTDHAVKLSTELKVKDKNSNHSQKFTTFLIVCSDLVSISSFRPITPIIIESCTPAVVAKP